MNIAGHVALVTGGAARIGASICRALAAEGCGVVVHYHRSSEAAVALAAELAARGVDAWTLGADLGARGRVEDVVDRAWQLASRPVDILVNNASVFHRDPLIGLSEEALRLELEVNMLAPILLSRRFVERLRSDGGTCDNAAGIRGRIVNLLDRRVAGFESGSIPYMLSKKGLADFTRCAALEWAPDIAVNGVAPGAILPPPGKGEDYIKEAAGAIPLSGRLRPGDVASTVLFALRSGFMTGQVLYVDGGQHLLGGNVIEGRGAG